MICILVRLVKFSDPSTCREILGILILRASNYLISRTAQYEAEEGCELEVTLNDDDLLNDQMHLASYVLRKGVLAHELAQGKPVSETCNLLRQVMASLEAHKSQVRSPEDLKPAKFAPTALWFSVLRLIYEKVHEVKNQGEVDPLTDKPEFIECSNMLLNATFEMLRMFKSASKYNIKILSEGTAYLLHGSVQRVSPLFGQELDLMIQFAVLHLTAAPVAVSAENCKLLFREIICEPSSQG